MHAINWDDLRVVLAIARGRTHSAAAVTLGVTHTTVSRRLRACEQRLGTRLFDRTPDGLHPTSAGDDLLQLAERMEGEVFATEARIMGQDVELRGPLRVSTLDMLFRGTRAAFTSFIERYPSVDLTVTTPMDPVSLSRREADVALRLSSKPPEGLIGRRLGKLDFGIYASPELVARVGADAPLSAYPWIGLDEQLSNGWLDHWMRQHAPGARVAMRIDENTLLMRDLVMSGVGVFFLPRWEGAALGLRRLPAAVDDQGAEVWLLTHPDLRGTSRVRAFLDHMVAVAPELPMFQESPAQP